MKAGKIGAIGLSEMSADTLRRASAVTSDCRDADRIFAADAQSERIAVLEACRELGTTFVAFSPVGRGALCGVVREPQSLPADDIRRSMPRFVGENWVHNLALIDAFAALAKGAGVTPAQLALGWVLAKGDHIVTIPGTASIAHLEENIARHDWRPDTDTVARVDALINRERCRVTLLARDATDDRHRGVCLN